MSTECCLVAAGHATAMLAVRGKGEDWETALSRENDCPEHSAASPIRHDRNGSGRA